ncbi:hypothetical protein ES332_A05G101100v1 [Gossypium tomentosum]|uniref:Uncharacterized protein n=1 Tax=Gossypium tomentosum TaxID=34277 RepID=A0A5D2QD89_GOSTO|nr:hypothetical protein ES332_A05G101100v1 [Gossypium tomentosum]
MEKVAVLPTGYPKIRLLNLVFSYIPQKSFLSFVLNLPALILFWLKSLIWVYFLNAPQDFEFLQMDLPNSFHFLIYSVVEIVVGPAVVNLSVWPIKSNSLEGPCS